MQPKMGFLLLCLNEEGKRGVTRAGGGMEGGLEDPRRLPVRHGTSAGTWGFPQQCLAALPCEGSREGVGSMWQEKQRQDTSLGRE